MPTPAFTHSYIVTNRDRQIFIHTYGSSVEPNGQNYYIAAPNSTAGVYLTAYADYDSTSSPLTNATTLPSDFAAALQADLELCARDASGNYPLCIYIHGLENDWKTTCSGYGSYGQNLGTPVTDPENQVTTEGFGGLLVAYSWPSALTDMADYSGTRSRIRDGITNFVNFIQALRSFITNNMGGAVSLSVICHSEGNYMLEQACNAMLTAGLFDAPLFNQAIMLAADIGADQLNTDKDPLGIVTLCTNVSVYYSSQDTTLQRSQSFEVWNHEDDARLGLEGPRSHADGTALGTPYVGLSSNCVGIDCSDVVKAGNTYETPSSSIHTSYRYIPQVVQDTVFALAGIAATDPQRGLTAIGSSNDQGFTMTLVADSFGS